MPTPNPYSPPSSRVEPASPVSSVRPSFPWLLVLRWLVGVATVLTGLYGWYVLAKSWDAMADQAIIATAASPYNFLPAALLKVATGVAILLRSKWSVLLAVGWLAAFVYLFLGMVQWKNLPPAFFLSLMEQLGILGFICLLWFRGRLR